MSSLIALLPTLPAGPTSEFEYVLSDDGRSVGSHGSAAAALLPAPRGAGAEVIAVVPVERLSWHRVDLPKGTSAGSPRLRAVLEGLLEDRLLDEPETLHFALQPQARPEAPAWIAVCDRQWLRDAVQALEAAGRPAARIVPEFTPEGPDRLYAMGTPDRPMLVAAGDEGVTLLPLSAQALALLPALADDARRLAEPAVAALAEQLLHGKLELQQAPGRWLAAAQSEWDLAQFDLASSGQARAFKKAGAAWVDFLRAPAWRLARWALLLLVVVNLVGLNAWAWRERTALADKREQIRRILTQTFPQVKVVVDAPLQMEREVTAMRQLTGATSGRDMEAMLAALGVAAPQRVVTALEFSAGELRVKGLAFGPEEAQAVAASLKGQGYAFAPQGNTMLITQGTGP